MGEGIFHPRTGAPNRNHVGAFSPEQEFRIPNTVLIASIAAVVTISSIATYSIYTHYFSSSESQPDNINKNKLNKALSLMNIPSDNIDKKKFNEELYLMMHPDTQTEFLKLMDKALSTPEIREQMSDSNIRFFSFYKEHPEIPIYCVVIEEIEENYEKFMHILSPENQKRVLEFTAECLTKKICYARELKKQLTEDMKEEL